MAVIAHKAAVLGKPIAHSLSPVLHNAAYEALGLDDWHYGREEVGVDDLDAFLHGLDPTWRGLSLTMPLKRAIIPYGTPQDKWVKLLGVANTAVFEWQMQNTAHPELPAIRLYNTDVYGIYQVLLRGIRNRNNTRSALIIGNGNTAHSAFAALSMLKVRNITIAARHSEKSAPFIKLGTELRVDTTLAKLEGVFADMSSYDFVVSTVPAHVPDPYVGGLQPGGRPLGTLLDVVYDPRPTALMQAWSDNGGTAIGGQEMLLQQAIPQVAYMTSTSTDEIAAQAENHMREALNDAL